MTMTAFPQLKLCSWFTLIILCLASTAHAQVVQFKHKKAVDLKLAFRHDGLDGEKPRGLTFDGTSAYVGGASYDSPSVGIVKIVGLRRGADSDSGGRNSRPCARIFPSPTPSSGH